MALTLVTLSSLLAFGGCAGGNPATRSDASGEGAEHTEVAREVAPRAKGTVVVLATGGTIAGTGEEGMVTGYDPGAIAIDSIISSVPEIADIAPIEAVQVANLNSDDVTARLWIDLANTINEMAADPNVCGFVITHGTDTLEETAYFLNLTVKTDKPVVLTGSMRPATSLSPDGPMNLYEAVCIAASEEASGYGVLVVFSDHVYSARSVAKMSTYDVRAISAGESGAIGIVRDGIVHLYGMSTRRHTTETEFDVAGMETLPKVPIVYFAVDADPGLLSYAAGHAEGLVVAGAGAGEFSREFAEVIEGLEIPVVVSSRIDDGIIMQDSLICENTIAADNLSPQKAAILLRLAMATGDTSRERLIRLFQTY